MKKYSIYDKQGADLWDYTRDNPMTANKIRKKFWDYEDCRTQKYNQFTLDYIAEMWHIEFDERKKCSVCERYYDKSDIKKNEHNEVFCSQCYLDSESFKI